MTFSSFLVFQLGYTTLFGAFSAFLFLSTGQLTCSLFYISHSFIFFLLPLFYLLSLWPLSLSLDYFVGFISLFHSPFFLSASLLSPLFLSGNAIGPISAHILCNALGFPDFEGALSATRSVKCAFVFGLLSFLSLLFLSPVPQLLRNSYSPYTFY